MQETHKKDNVVMHPNLRHKLSQFWKLLLRDDTGMCMWEKMAIASGLELIHDGKRNPGQFDLSSQDVTFYTRRYKLKNEPFVLVFKYDKRECVDIYKEREEVSVAFKDGIRKQSGELILEQVKQKGGDNER